MVNLSVIDQNGAHHRAPASSCCRTKPLPPEGYFAQWMPFQKVQASNADTKSLIGAILDRTEAQGGRTEINTEINIDTHGK